MHTTACGKTGSSTCETTEVRIGISLENGPQQLYHEATFYIHLYISYS
jgi:hypothetical protein